MRVMRHDQPSNRIRIYNSNPANPPGPKAKMADQFLANLVGFRVLPQVLVGRECLLLKPER